MLREYPSTNWYRIGARALIIVCLIVLVGGCSDDEVHHVSIHELRVHNQDYIGKKVVLKGFLSGRYAEAHGSPYLFATTDDAMMRNQAAAVFIDLYENPWVNDIDKCMEHFVQVWGTFRVTDNPYNPGLGVTDIDSLRKLPPSDAGLDEYCVGPAPADWEIQE
jgi:hypothetical protein